MSDEQNQNKEQQAKDARGPKDWSTDYFPTSAKKVFITWGFMIGGIITLILIVYYSSEHPSGDPKTDSKKQAAQKTIDEMKGNGEEEDE